MSLFDGAKVVGAERTGLLTLPRTVNAHYGASAVCLRKPAGRDTLLLRGEVGGPWRLGVGDQVARSFTAASGSATITATSHGYVTVDGPFALSSTSSMPGGLSSSSAYYTRAVDQHSLSLFLTEVDARHGDDPVIPSSAGAGTQYIQGRPLVAAANGEIVDGLYGFPITTGDGLRAFAAPDRMTVVGTGSADCIAYGWI